MVPQRSLPVLLLLLAAYVSCKSPPGASGTPHFPVAPLPGDLVQNGGFESGASHWSLSDTTNSGFGSVAGVYSGTQAVYVGTGSSGAILTQTISTQENTAYIVAFHYGSDGNTPNSFTFKINGDIHFSISDDSQHDPTLYTFAFTTSGGGTSTTLEFDGRNDNGYSYLDDVSVVQIPSPCNSNFYSYSSSNGRLQFESGKIYPGAPQPDSTFPVISNGEVLFNYKSDPMSAHFPRQVRMGLAPPSTQQRFDNTASGCQWQNAQSNDCPSNTDIGFLFAKGASGTIQEDLESLHTNGCISRSDSTSSSGSTITYSADVFTIWQDPYTLGNRWSELRPFTFSMTIPHTGQATFGAEVIVVSNDVSIRYQPVEVINMVGEPLPIVQLTSIAKTNYPFVAYGAGTKYTPPSSSATSATDSANGACFLFASNGDVATDTSTCDANPGSCTVECTRVIPISAPVCDLSGYTWQFDYKEYQDFVVAPGVATDVVDDPTWENFFETLLFNNNPAWNVCPTAASSDYSNHLLSEAVHGHYDSSSGSAVADSSSASTAATPLNFGFKISLDQSSEVASNKIYKATLTEMKVSRPDGTDFYLIGSSAGPTVGGAGPDQDRVTDLSFTPQPSSNVYEMTISPQASDSDPKFAIIDVTFTPKLGSAADRVMLYYADSSYSGRVQLTLTFAGTASLFADGSTPSKRDLVFRGEVAVPSSNGTVANATDIVYSIGTANSTTASVTVPSGRSVSAATIAGSTVGGLVGVGLLAAAGLWYRRHKAGGMISLPDKMEYGNL